MLVFYIGTDSAIARDFASLSHTHDFVLRSLDRRILEGMSGLYSSFFLDRFLPADYDQIVFVDADVQFWRPINVLLQSEPPSGQFFAVADPMAFEVDMPTSRSARLSQYMRGIGLDGIAQRSYFNSGVLRINRTGWNEIGMEALRFVQKKPQLCQFADQSALNAVSRGRQSLISLKWNFPIFLRNSSVEHLINPAIYHFMSKPKPWQGSFKPWDRRFLEPYSAALRNQPKLAPYLSPMPYGLRVKYVLQQWSKWGWESILWRRHKHYARLLAYESQVSSNMVSATAGNSAIVNIT